jgi:hypothetical protein
MAVPTQNKRRKAKKTKASLSPNGTAHLPSFFCVALKPTLKPTSCTLHPTPCTHLLFFKCAHSATPCTHLLSLNCGNALNPSEVTSTYIHTHIHADTHIHTAHILPHTHIHTYTRTTHIHTYTRTRTHVIFDPQTKEHRTGIWAGSAWRSQRRGVRSRCGHTGHIIQGNAVTSSNAKRLGESSRCAHEGTVRGEKWAVRVGGKGGGGGGGGKQETLFGPAAFLRLCNSACSGRSTFPYTLWTG